MLETNQALADLARAFLIDDDPAVFAAKILSYPRVMDPRGRPTQLGLKIVRSVVSPLVRLLFRPRLEGFDNLPDAPYMLVANHSAGMAIAELARTGAPDLEQALARVEDEIETLVRSL